MKIVIFLFFFVVIVVRYFQNVIVGMVGEFWVKRKLKKLNEDYRIINNVMIKTIDGKTHQIDHVVVSKYGIFVIETKQYNARLIGNDYDKKWVYKTYKKTDYIFNPVHQNRGHVLALKEVLNIEEDKFISIVCISSRASLKIDSNVVVGLDKLFDKINTYTEQIIYNSDEIYNEINSLNILNIKDRIKHVKNVKRYKKIKI